MCPVACAWVINSFHNCHFYAVRLESLRLCHAGNTRRIFKMTASHRVTPRTCACRLEMPQREADRRKTLSPCLNIVQNDNGVLCLVLIATQYKWFFSISYILLCLFLYYSADTRTINAMALFSLYLYFFSLILIFFSELANHSRESMQRSRHFSCLFSTLFTECWLAKTEAVLDLSGSPLVLD